MGHAYIIRSSDYAFHLADYLYPSPQGATRVCAWRLYIHRDRKEPRRYNSHLLGLSNDKSKTKLLTKLKKMIGEIRELEPVEETSPIVFTHGDLSSFNIVARVDGIVGIIDWETAGWYPSYWEYIHCSLPS